ncbi:LPS export ABC transporter ATP-binding protein [Desulfoplanes formicivorans]|uniref:Lipopolysaccharide export system ATP-binding protein LptB n=1 Tax=Desulfoplanes formicivorans TaxID=1592317 RepID=A0A194AIW4_9BACT|nr:LPS export ABC transporter ATP-binding protein [Desulfoplanes formicivorans]GAU09011.1 ABC transporter [Desulfoplanes formicivorans]
MAILRAHDLVKIFGKKRVVKGITIQVEDGEVVGLLGPNGAGKTTTFYMLVGIIRPNGGSVFLGDQEITRWPLHQRAKSGVSYLPQESSIFKKLTVRQNLMIILEYTGLSRKKRNEKADHLLEQLGITRLAHQKAAFLSGGERRRLEIARALIQDPTFILLDEPFAGIDPLAVEDIQQIIRSLRELGIGVLISDHNVRETLNICDRASIVYDGQIILEGTPDEIVNNPKARQIYLGEDFTL